MFDLEKLRIELFNQKDILYKKFQCKLIPSISPDSIIGVRIPVLRFLAKKIVKENDYESFLNILPHKFYEENNIHCYIIESIKDPNVFLKRLEVFLPYINNWSTCDTFKAKVLVKDPVLLISKIKEWIYSNKTYTVRFAIELLMKYFLDDLFKIEYLNLVSSIRSDEYYVNMMISWFFATALAKQWKCTYPYILNRKLCVWCHNKTIQKSVESFRISEEHKSLLKVLKY